MISERIGSQSESGKQVGGILAAATTVPEKNAQPRAAVLCATDRSHESTEAAHCAAAMAIHLGERLVLVHAVDERLQWKLSEQAREVFVHAERVRLHDLQEQLRRQSGKLFETSLRAGQPDVVLLEEAARHDARLLVLAGPKKPSPFPQLADPLPARVAESAHVPTFVVRDAASFIRWAGGGSPVRVLAGTDGSPASIAALDWLDWFRKFWPCELIVTCLETHSPSGQRGVVFPSLFMGEMVLKRAHTRERKFRAHVRALFGNSRVRVRYEKGWARCDHHLIHLAREECVDLIVVGTHSRVGWERLLHHSVSRSVLHSAHCNVVCVPERVREIRRKLSQPVYQPRVASTAGNPQGANQANGHILIPAPGFT
jgi:nucleotide-binding universal stress UspA family protein